MATSSKQRKTMSPFDELPDEIIVQIFHQMNSADRLVCDSVCKRFRKIIDDYFDDYFSNLERKEVPFSVLNTLYRGEEKYLSLSGSFLVNDVSSDDLKELTGRLKYLNLNDAVPNKEIVQILSTCSRLEKLSLNRISGNQIISFSNDIPCYYLK